MVDLQYDQVQSHSAGKMKKKQENKEESEQYVKKHTLRAAEYLADIRMQEITELQKSIEDLQEMLDGEYDQRLQAEEKVAGVEVEICMIMAKQ